MFLGTFSPRLDDKNRLILPAKWRPSFESGIVLTRGQERCVFAFARSAFESLVDELAGAPLTNKDARDYSRMLLAGAQDEVPDKQGRITVAPLLREYAGLTRDLAVLGVGRRLEIWDAATWQQLQEQGEQAFSERSTEIVPGVL
ncbi:division/cell wall cluster transcriptional repressor MraZ [Aquipuribacter sp. SD81]|uniref:division/cell wall cluster transcriptional repressor MraZ n=1 Tax=Aquipuribacter sp. SD81 TaxID=3127703 RepID=UPI0030169806